MKGGSRRDRAGESVPRAVGRLVKSMRESRNLTQADAARLARDAPWGVSRSAISAIERGRNLPSLEALIALSRVLQMDPGEFLERLERLRAAPADLAGLRREDQERRAQELFWAGDFRGAVAVYDAMLHGVSEDRGLPGPEKRRLRAAYELQRAGALRRCGLLGRAKRSAERAVALSMAHPPLQAEAYMVLAALHRQEGNIPLGLDAAGRAEEVASRCGDRVQGRALLQKGACLLQAGRPEEALEMLGAARERALRSKDHKHRTHIEGNIGMCHLAMGRQAHARNRLVRAVLLARRHAAPALEASWLVELGRLALTTGDAGGAGRYAAAALRIARPLEQWLTVFRAEWLQHLIQEALDSEESDRHRIRYLKKLLVRLDRHEADPTLREFRARILGIAEEDEEVDP